MASVISYTGMTGNVITALEGTTHDSYAIGDLVRTDTDGRIVLANAGNVLGIARRGYTGTPGSVVEVELIDSNEIYVIAHKAAATAQNLVGLACDLVYTAGAQNVNTGANATKEVEVVGLHPGDAIETSGGRLLVRFKPAAIDAR